MNIFVLDKNPKKCAEMTCDRPIIKMPLESAQMICTTHHLFPNTSVKYDIPYKQTHVNHPCTKWVRSSLSNYKWLVELTRELNNEYKFRYNKDNDHKSWDKIKDLPLPNIPDIGMTVWARAMPDELKITGKNKTYTDIVKSYRNYYNVKKSAFAKWKNRGKPRWYKPMGDIIEG
jgi:hypothetical protein